MQFLQEATLTSSVGMRMFNNNKEMTIRINEVIKKGVVIEKPSIELQLYQIKRSRLSPLVDKVLTAYENQDIVLLHCGDGTKVPPGTPFVTVKSGSYIRSFVFLNNFTGIKIDKTTNVPMLDIQMKDLYALMESAYVSKKYYEYQSLLQRNLGLMKMCVVLYTNMILRILNKDYSLSMDKLAYDKVSFCISKFFLETVWEAKNPGVITQYSMANILNPDKSELAILEDEYDAYMKAIDTPPSFIDLTRFLSERFPRLRDLHIRLFMQSYINYYKPNAMFGLDVLPYFLFIVISTILGSFVINQTIMKDIIKNTNTVKMGAFYAELSKIV